ncbi:putative acetyltransferase [Mesorhizobium soli]|uniref:GNAT family N-acetyltransferase n=1 Tax=Pseudaminobacter soli (ex Li et al. 2025) TaxID=1295366 RepID=UPI002473EBDC|nr:N-acetyltransferase [Mesorhizobium soli]MDH6230929.1 putative acetyltransferase [Mesorhizobium soli]
MSTVTVRQAAPEDRKAIFGVEERAFGRKHEADLVERVVADGEGLLELVAERDGRIVGHVLFSRLLVDPDGQPFDAVSLAPLAVDPDYQGQGVGSALVRCGHEILKERGERLAVVVGDPDYYGRFGYARAGAEKFESDYQGDAMQALYWGEAPTSGQLAHPRAFAGW